MGAWVGCDNADNGCQAGDLSVAGDRRAEELAPRRTEIIGDEPISCIAERRARIDGM